METRVSLKYFVNGCRFSNCAKQDLPLPDSRKGALEPPLSSAIICGLLLYEHAIDADHSEK